MYRPTVLVISDELLRSEPITALLDSRQCRPVLFSDIDQAISAIRDGEAIGLSVLTGRLQFCEAFLKVRCEFRFRRNVPPLVVVALDGSEAFAVAALRAGASDYFSEPLDLLAFADSVSRCIPLLPAAGQSDGLTGGEVLVGNTPAIQALRVNIRRLAATDCNVLITGETGTVASAFTALFRSPTVFIGPAAAATVKVIVAAPEVSINVPVSVNAVASANPGTAPTSRSRFGPSVPKASGAGGPELFIRGTAALKVPKLPGPAAARVPVTAMLFRD